MGTVGGSRSASGGDDRAATHYFSTYKLLVGGSNKVAIAGTYGREHAERVVTASLEDYKEAYGETPPTLRF